jgi:Protein of unknown function DUF262
MSREATEQQNTEDFPVDEVMEENEAAVTYDIASYPSDLTLSVIAEMWKNGDIEIPEFQRNFVWSIRQSSLLIESFLLGLPVPQVFFYINDQHKNLVIDGQQRILSVVSYFEGYLVRKVFTVDVKFSVSKGSTIKAHLRAAGLSTWMKFRKESSGRPSSVL